MTASQVLAGLFLALWFWRTMQSYEEGLGLALAEGLLEAAGVAAVLLVLGGLLATLFGIPVGMS